MFVKEINSFEIVSWNSLSSQNGVLARI